VLDELESRLYVVEVLDDGEEFHRKPTKETILQYAKDLETFSFRVVGPSDSQGWLHWLWDRDPMKKIPRETAVESLFDYTAQLEFVLHEIETLWTTEDHDV
jgi:hypothetical protein